MRIRKKALFWILGIIILFVCFFLFLDKSKMMSFPIVSNFQDRIIEKQWAHPEILQEESGSIYTLGENNKLVRFNVGTNKWEKTKSPYIDSERWGISKTTLACFVSPEDVEKKKISIFSMPEFRLINTINLDVNSYSLAMPYPDNNGKYVAVTDPIRNSLVIFSISNGEKIFEYNYFSGDLIDWSSDSTKILFSSFDENDGAKFRTASFINVYDLRTRTFEKICQGWQPRWGRDENKVLFRKSVYGYSCGDIFEFNRKTKKERLLLHNIRLYDYCWSPSGKNFLVAIPQKAFSLYHWPQWLTVINYDNPKLRFIVLSGLNSSGNSNERFFWTDN